MTQPRLPGTTPSPEEARRNHRAAVKKRKLAESMVENLRESLKDARHALKQAKKEVEAAEEDLEAIDEGRRPDRAARE